MGGSGSGRPADAKKRKRRVEECIRLDLQKLLRQGLEEHGRVFPRIVSQFTGVEGLPRYYEMRLDYPAVPESHELNYPRILQILRLRPSGGESLTLEDVQFVGLEQTLVQGDSRRLWMRCPGFISVPGFNSCGRRVSHLYLPPDRREFRCRTCYDLVYESSQTWNCSSKTKPSGGETAPSESPSRSDLLRDLHDPSSYENLLESIPVRKRWEDSPEGLASIAALAVELKRLGLSEGDEVYAQTMALAQDLLRGGSGGHG